MLVILHLGSNQGDRQKHLENAITIINLEVGPLVATSAYYETEAWGITDQPDFINQAITITTELQPEVLLQAILEIEIRLGRKRVTKWGPRAIDIDILFYEDQVIHSPTLTIPHPHLHERNFVLIPVMEISGDFVHPIFNLTVEELYLRSRDEGNVYLLEEE